MIVAVLLFALPSERPSFNFSNPLSMQYIFSVKKFKNFSPNKGQKEEGPTYGLAYDAREISMGCFITPRWWFCYGCR